MNGYLAACGVALAIGAGGCSEPPAAPTSLILSAQLTNAGSTDRGILVQIVGADTSAHIDTLLAPTGSSYRLFTQRLSNTQWRAIVTGNLSDGALLRLTVPGRSRKGAYTAAILDVADASFAALAPGSRAVTIAP